MDTDFSSNRLLITDAFLVAKEELLDKKKVLNRVVFDDSSDFEITAYSTEYAAQINIRKLDFLFVIIQIERRVFEYSLNDFSDLCQIKSLIDSFLTGEYSFSMGGDNVPLSIKWKSGSLKELNRVFEHEPIESKQILGYSLT